MFSAVQRRSFKCGALSAWNTWPTSMPIALGQGEGPGSFLFDADLSGAGDLGLDDWLDIWNPLATSHFTSLFQLLLGLRCPTELMDTNGIE